MELCREVLDGLSLLKNEQINGQKMQEILKQCKRLLFRSKLPPEDAKDITDETLTTIEEKLVKLSICSLVLELAKHNSGPEAIESVLEECGLKSSPDNKFNPNCLKLIEFYRNIRIELRQLLNEQTHDPSLPEIIDVQWNQFYVLKSDTKDKINEFQYLIQINCDRSVVNDSTDIAFGSQDLTFNASLPQLQDLCHKLRECRKLVEKAVK